MQGGCRHAPALQRRLASGGQPAPLAAARGGGGRAIEPGPAVAAAFAPTGTFTQGVESLAARNGPRHATTRPRAMEATAADASGARDGALGCGATADELCLEKGFAVRGATSGAGALAQRKAAANPSTSKGVYRLEKKLRATVTGLCVYLRVLRPHLRVERVGVTRIVTTIPIIKG